MNTMQYIQVKNDTYRIAYDLRLRNKFTFLIGDSATGKTQLSRLISSWLDFEEQGRRSATTVKSSLQVNVLNGLEKLQNFKNGILIVDENYTSLIKKNLEYLTKSNAYYVFVFRELLNIPFGVYDICKFSANTTNGYTINTLVPLYEMKEFSVIPECVITEDQASGYKFYKSTLSTKCISAKGKTRIAKSVRVLANKGVNNILLVVDEVGFGFEFSKIVDICSSREMRNKDIYIWLPKSFEYVLLNSGMFTEIDDFLEDPYDSWDLSKYSTVEKYISAVLNREMKKKLGVRYSKGEDMLKYFKDYKLMIFNRNFTNYEKLLK